LEIILNLRILSIMCLKTVQSTMGKLGKEPRSDKDRVRKSGQMVLSTKDSGRTIWLKVLESLFMLTEISTMENGKLTKRTEKELILIQMAPDMLVTGLKISSMELEKKLGQMVPHTKETTRRAKKMAKETLGGRMVQCLWEISKITTLKESEFTLGLTEGCTRESGRTTRCTEREFLRG